MSVQHVAPRTGLIGTSVTSDDLRRFHGGDQQFFALLLVDRAPRLLNEARRLTRDVDDAEDLVQETLIRVYEKRETYRGDAPIYVWMRCILTSVANQRRRAARRRAAKVPALSMHAEGDGGAPADDAVNEAIDAQQRRRWLIDALVRLPQRQRDILILRFLGGRSTKQVAHAMACAPGTVKATVAQAIRRLRAATAEGKGDSASSSAP